MIETSQVEVGGEKLLGLKVCLPRAPLLLLIYEDVLIGCGYFDIEAMEKMGDKACVVSGVENFDQVLDSEIRDFTTKAGDLGAEVGLKVAHFIEGV